MKAPSTQDGYDWPTPHPAPPKPMAPYFRAQLLEDSEVQLADVPPHPEQAAHHPV